MWWGIQFCIEIAYKYLKEKWLLIKRFFRIFEFYGNGKGYTWPFWWFLTFVFMFRESTVFWFYIVILIILTIFFAWKEAGQRHFVKSYERFKTRVRPWNMCICHVRSYSYIVMKTSEACNWIGFTKRNQTYGWRANFLITRTGIVPFLIKTDPFSDYESFSAKVISFISYHLGFFFWQRYERLFMFIQLTCTIIKKKIKEQ